MKKFFVIAAILSSSSFAVMAGDTSKEQELVPNAKTAYAIDKLANAQAQLNKLKTQRKAIDNLIRAVEKDLKAARIRAKAEKLQISADSDRQNAVSVVEQTGLAVDLPNLMNAPSQEPLINKQIAKDELDSMFRDRNSTKSASVFFPGGSSGKRVEPLNKDIPDYIK